MITYIVFIHKKISEKQAGDARKYEEMERRQQKNKEKLSSDGTATIMAKKLQAESIARMSKHSLPMKHGDDSVEVALSYLTLGKSFLKCEQW